MKTKKLTIYVILFIAVLAIAYDFYAIAVGGTEASISHVMKVWGYKYPIVTFSMGILMGHFYWPVKQTRDLDVIGKMIKDLDKE